MQFEFKCVVVGDMGVGKSEFAQMNSERQTAPTRGSPQRRLPHSDSTIGIDLVVASRSHGSRSCRYQIWDTAGQERFRACTFAYFRGAQCAILLYDLTSADSFRALSDWHAELAARAAPTCRYFVVGTKSDRLASYERGVTPDEVAAFAERIGGAPTYETNVVHEGGYYAYATFTEISRVMAETADASLAGKRLDAHRLPSLATSAFTEPAPAATIRRNKRRRPRCAI